MSVIRERRRYFKREAKFFLRYNYIKQIFMTGIVVLLTFGFNAIKLNAIKLFGLEYSFYAVPLGIFFDLLIFFITLPMYAGIVYVNAKLFEGENLPVSGVFYYFTSVQNLLDCYKFMTAICARLAVFAVPFLFTGAAFPLIDPVMADMLGDYAQLDFVMLCISLAYILAFIICLVVFMRYFAALFIFVKNPCLSVRDIMSKSVKMMKKRKIEGLLLLLSFAFWVIISHFLAGFLYIFFTVPYITLCYASFMTYILTEKGGDDFLNTAGDYIDELAKTKKASKVKEKKAEEETAAADEPACPAVEDDVNPPVESDSQTELDKVLQEKTAQIDGIVYSEIDERHENKKFGFLNRLFRR